MLPQRHQPFRLSAILTLATAGVLFGLTHASAQDRERQDNQRENRRDRDEIRDQEPRQDQTRNRDTDRRDAEDFRIDREDSDRDRGRTEERNTRDRQDRDRESATDRRRTSDQRDDSRRQGDDRQDRHADDESPELGLVAGSCPGAGVCVMGTASGGPAQRADIRHGDYILTVNDQQVSNPRELKEEIERREPGDQIELEIWRQGQIMLRNVVLAARSQASPRGQQAWIGVQIEAGEDRGGQRSNGQEGQSDQVRIASVQPGSPAARAGLQEGDILTQIAGEDIDSIDSLMDQVQAAGPGQELELEVLRNGRRQTVTVDVGHIDDAPVSWQRRAFRRSEQMPSSGWLGETDQSINAVLDRMRQQIRSLQRQVEEMQSGNHRADVRDEYRDQDSRSENRDQPDSADNRRNSSDRLRNRDVESEREDGSVSLNSDAAADQQRETVAVAANDPILVAQRYRNHDHDRNWRDRGYRRNSGNNWYNRNWYRRGNHSYYRSPRYGNSYYWNRGRPYYNNRWNRWGNREGFSISPYGFSYYW